MLELVINNAMETSFIKAKRGGLAENLAVNRWAKMRTLILALLMLISIAAAILWIEKSHVFQQYRANNVERSENITKSPHDKRLYRGLKLQNGLRALLISDPTTDVSAAALAVGAGSINDFRDLPGIAHFLEHMLFMGSKKYPEENDFGKFVADHSGYTNAYTDNSITNYHFEVSCDSLFPALDRFAQFFLGPLLAASAIGREVMAVDSEHKLHLVEDEWRIEQLEVSMSDPGHPYNHFSIGNQETLYKIPTSKGISVRDQLVKFHSTWYSSNIMTLTILGKESLDKLENQVAFLFKDVENKNVSQEVYPYEKHPWGPNQLKHIVYVLPVADIHLLKLIFPTPDLANQYKTAPTDFVANLLGHEGPGSLHSVLKKRGLASAAYTRYSSTAGFGFFIIEFELTDTNTGIDEIITLVFQYIELLRNDGIQKWMFEENKKNNEIAFMFKDKESPISYVQTLARSMQDVRIEDVLSFGFIHDQWNASLIRNFLSYLRPDNMNVIMASKSFEKNVDRIEPWFGTKYKVEKTSDDLMEKWSTVQPSSELKLPPRNEYIPDNFNLYPLRKNESGKPRVIQESLLSRFWFKQDDKFGLPKLEIRFEILNSMGSQNPDNRNLLEMFILLLEDSLSEMLYAASLAGLQRQIIPTETGIYVRVFGYNEKLPLLLERIVSTITTFQVDEKRLQILKEWYIRNMKNFETEGVRTYANSYLGSLVSERRWTIDERLAATEILQKENIEKFAKKFLSAVFIQGLIYGNCNQKKAMEIVKIIETPFKSVSQVPAEIPLLRQVKINDGSNLKYEVSNKYDPNSCCFVYFQCSTESTRNNTILNLFLQIIKEPCFDILRTKEQLGYVVYCTIRRTNGVQGFVVVVESERHPTYVDSRVEAFLQTVHKMLEDMSKKEFESYKSALAKKILEKPKQLESQSNKYWDEITTRLYNFERDNKEVELLASLKKKDILEFFKESIDQSSKKRRKLAIHVISAVTNPVPELSDAAPEVRETKIKDVVTFRNASEFLPLPPPYIKINPLGISATL